MALIGEMQYLTIGGSTYSIPTGTTVEVERNLTSGTKSATIKVDGISYDLYAPTPNAGTVTSVRVQATSPVQSSTSTAQSSSLNTTISLANGYGDTKNPYGTKTKNYVLAGPTTGNDAAPTFRALVAADIPDLSGTYLTSYIETDPVYSASAASGITSSDISNWNSKTSNTGTITSVKTTAGAHTTINVSSGAVNFNVPTKTSHLTNDSGFITSYTDEKVKTNAATASSNYYVLMGTNTNEAETKIYDTRIKYSYTDGTSSTPGIALLSLGNDSNILPNSIKGRIKLYAQSGSVTIDPGASQNSTVLTLPNTTGTLALTSDIPDTSGFISTETDPVFSTSAAAGITSTDISNWNAKVSDTGKWNGVELKTGTTLGTSTTYVPGKSNSTAGSGDMYFLPIGVTPTAGYGVKWDNNKYIYTTTPSANDNSTKVATTAYVDAAIPKVYSSTNTGGYLTMATLPIYDGTVQ